MTAAAFLAALLAAHGAARAGAAELAAGQLWLPPLTDCYERAALAQAFYDHADRQRFLAATPAAASAWEVAAREAGQLVDWWNLACQVHDPGHNGLRHRRCRVKAAWDGAAGAWAVSSEESAWVAGDCDVDPREALRQARALLGDRAWFRQEFPPPVPIWRIPLLDPAELPGLLPPPQRPLPARAAGG